MKVNVYYGGRGLIEDSTIYTINKIIGVLEELRVNVVRYNFYEKKSDIAIMPQTFKDADAVVLAVNLEWMGIGGLMQQFLDACWLYGDKEKIKTLYMMPVVVASTFGEKNVESTLIKAWELLGGIPIPGVTAFVEDQTEFETSAEYAALIEKQAENLYRAMKQKPNFFPSSTKSIFQKTLHINGFDLTPQESEQLSVYVSDDNYVKKQKKDIEELSLMFKDMMENGSDEGKNEYIKSFRDNFKPIEGEYKASYSITLSDARKTLVAEIVNQTVKLYYGEKEDSDVYANTTREVINKLVNGRITMQGAFMSGQLTAKGDFRILRMFDQLFQFKVL